MAQAAKTCIICGGFRRAPREQGQRLDAGSLDVGAVAAVLGGPEGSRLVFEKLIFLVLDSIFKFKITRPGGGTGEASL